MENDDDDGTETDAENSNWVTTEKSVTQVGVFLSKLSLLFCHRSFFSGEILKPR